MSYSFSVRAATKKLALEQVSTELAKIVEQQPVHRADIAHAGTAAESLLNVLAEDPERDVGISVNGSIWETDAGIKEVSCSVSAKLIDKKSP